MSVVETLGPRIASLYEMQSAWLEPRLRELGVGWTSFQLLLAVHSGGGEASQRDVAERLDLSAATLSEAVQNHRDQGLLVQRVSSKDRRVRTLALTTRAEELLSRIRDLIADSEKALTADLSQEEIDKCALLLDKALNGLQSSLPDDGSVKENSTT